MMELKEESAKPRGFFGVRHIQFLLLFTGALIAYGMRVNLSVGVIYMFGKYKSPNPDIPNYPEWEDQENIMHSSFFMGYVCLQIGAGQLAEKYGPKRFLFCSIIISSIFSILIPVLGGAIGYAGVILCRVVQGLSQGFLFPSIHHLISQWTPLPERAKIGTFIYCGGPLGSVISNLLTGQICKSWLGWPAAFYIYGGLGLGWAGLWIVLGSDSPSLHKYISASERKYIEAFTSTEKNHHTGKTPWKAIATSLPMWAILISHCGQNWGYWTLSDKIPGYLTDILHMDKESNTVISAVPYFVLWILSLIISPIADYLIVKQITTIGVSRKLFNTLGLFIPAVSLIALCFVDEGSSTVAVVLLVVAVGSNANVYCGFNVNHIDLSPNHAGTLMGITNSLSNVFSIIAPLSIDAIKHFGYEQTDKGLWTIVFSIAAGAYFVTGTFFLVFASGEIQSWDSSDGDIEESKEEKE